jgi:hypothetical protein
MPPVPQASSYKQVGAGLELAFDGQEHQVGHQPHGVARCPVFAGLFVVVFVELAHQLFEHRAHRVVVDAGRREVDVGIEELVDQRAQRVGLGQRGQLVAELEVLQDVLDVGREAVEVVDEVGQQLLGVAARFQVTQREARGVVEGLAGRVGQRGALLGDVRVVQHLLGVEHGLLGGLEHSVHAPQHAHRQDDVGVLAAPEQVAQDIVGDAPDEGDDAVVRCLVHVVCFSRNRWPGIIQLRGPSPARRCCLPTHSTHQRTPLS